MSGTLISSNVTMKVNRAITSTTTVASNGYAIVCYHPTSTTNSSSGFVVSQDVVTMYYGPSQSVPATLTLTHWYTAGSYTVTFTLNNGVEFINTP